MVDTNYVGSIVKILESPIQKTLNDKVISTEFRVQLPQIRNIRMVNLVVWGNLAADVANYYKVNDYIMIEGYLSFDNRINDKFSKQTIKKTQITCFKIYPIFCKSN
jgi:single-stranded DNA-binding protein